MAVTSVLQKNKKNKNDTYAQWVTDTETNAVLENTDTTPKPNIDYSAWYAPTFGTPSASPSSTPSATEPTPERTPVQKPLQPNNVPPTATPPSQTPTIDYSAWAPTAGTSAKNDLIEKFGDPLAGYRNPSLALQLGKGSWAPEEPKKEEVKPEENPVATPNDTPSAENDFSKWLAADPAMQARMRQAESDYYRNRAGYGVQGENLAQSGLLGSGWDSHLDATAYAAMQAEKAGVRSEGYAKWLGDQEAAKAEGTVNDEKLAADSQTVFSHLVEQGKNSVTDTDLSYLYGLGFSKDAIDKAVTAYNDYAAKSKSEASNAFKDSLNTLMGEGTAADFLGSLGVSTEGMTVDEINATTDAAIEQAFKDGTLTAEDRSAYYKAGQILDEDMAGWSADDVMTNAVNSVTNARSMFEGGKLTESDFKEIVNAAYKAINVQNLHLAGVSAELGQQSAADMIQFTVDIDGKKTNYTADMVSVSGSKVDKDSNLAKALSTFGKASFAAYDGGVYYQYKDGDWVKISTKALAGSAGSKKDGDKILRVIAEYYAANHIKIGDGQSRGRR